MPTYSYKCAECGHAFDIHQSFSDDALTVCPECGGPLRKVFGSVGVTFKGSGFYRTDSRAGTSQSTPAKRDAGSDSKPASGDTKTTGTSTEKKSTDKKSTSTASTTGAGSAA